MKQSFGKQCRQIHSTKRSSCRNKEFSKASTDLGMLHKMERQEARSLHPRRSVRQSFLHTLAQAVHTRLPTPSEWQAPGRLAPSRSACCDAAAVLQLQSLPSFRPCKICKSSHASRFEKYFLSLHLAGRIQRFQILNTLLLSDVAS